MNTQLNPPKVKLVFANKSNNPNPEYAKEGDSGFDLRAWVTAENTPNSTDQDGNPIIVLRPGQCMVVHTGLYFELPPFTELQVRSRSGLSLKYGIVVRNGPGTIDFGFRNEVGVILENRGNCDFVIHNGDRIAQAVLCPVFNSPLVDLTQTDEVSTDTDRALQGFGHSGIK